MNKRASEKIPILNTITRASELDLLSLAIINLLEMTSQGEINLILDQKEKSDSHKKAFLQKIVSNVESPQLREVLHTEIATSNWEFFREDRLEDFLRDLQKESEGITVVRLTVAIEFKPADIQKMVDQLSEQLNKPVVLDITVERSLIGGAVVQYGTAIRDYSVKTRLEQFAENWKTAVIEG